jgi:hypothetical protein
VIRVVLPKKYPYSIAESKVFELKILSRSGRGVILKVYPYSIAEMKVFRN